MVDLTKEIVRVSEITVSQRGAVLYRFYWNQKFGVEVWLKPSWHISFNAKTGAYAVDVFSERLSETKMAEQEIEAQQRINEAIKYEKEFKAESRRLG
tara:strand:- start:7399 stop:7689 length:291 start_codon:yes stop_codon:yes gene_type:complete